MVKASSSGSFPLRATSSGSLRDLPCWNDVADVVALRNLLSHYGAETIWLSQASAVTEDSTAALTTKMAERRKSRGGKAIEPTPLWWGYPFPLTQLNHQCAAWAVNTSRQFVAEFSQVMGLLPSPLRAGDDYDAARGQPSRFDPTPQPADQGGS
jgi:hypothetical protein